MKIKNVSYTFLKIEMNVNTMTFIYLNAQTIKIKYK